MPSHTVLKGLCIQVPAVAVSQLLQQSVPQEGAVPQALSGAMADYMFIACFATEDEAWAFAGDVFREK